MIRQRAFNDHLLLIDGMDYKGEIKYIIIYGLEFKRFSSYADAAAHWLDCARHHLSADMGAHSNDYT